MNRDTNRPRGHRSTKGDPRRRSAEPPPLDRGRTIHPSRRFTPLLDRTIPPAPRRWPWVVAGLLLAAALVAAGALR